MPIFAIIGSMFLITILWWWAADRILAKLELGGRWSRIVLGLFAGFHAFFLVWLLVSRFGGFGASIPKPLLVSGYVWNLLVVPMVLVPWLLLFLGYGLVKLTRWLIRKPSEAVSAPAPQPVVPAPDESLRLSRRQVLALGAISAPPLLSMTGAASALVNLDHFRVRRIEVPIPGLPSALDGFRIAHLTDSHVGRFTRGRVLDEIAAATNALKPNVVAFTGDLIDHTLKDLPEAARFLNLLQPEQGLMICEGNHDLFESREGFEEGLAAAGIPLLINRGSVISHRGAKLEFLGMKWGGVMGGRRNPGLEENLIESLAVATPDATRILLAHHPHAFDAAAREGIPLVLAGHTHGGQLMLTDEVGGGPIAFRYWSGLYRQANSRMVVSNGVGNWFPLRVNAPAEIVEVTLRATDAEKA